MGQNKVSPPSLMSSDGTDMVLTGVSCSFHLLSFVLPRNDTGDSFSAMGCLQFLFADLLFV